MANKMRIFNTNIIHFPMRESWVKKFKELNAEYIGNVCLTEDDIIKYAKDVDIIEIVRTFPFSIKL